MHIVQRCARCRPFGRSRCDTDTACVCIQAAANAKNNLGLSKVKLYISECFADEAPTMKRFMPRAKGR